MSTGFGPCGHQELLPFVVPSVTQGPGRAQAGSRGPRGVGAHWDALRSNAESWAPTNARRRAGGGQASGYGTV